jgi:hypothetical protein
MRTAPNTTAAREVDGGTAATVDAVAAAILAGDTDRYVELCAPDALLDLVVPFWRFQLVGRSSIRESLKGEFLPERHVTEQHVTRTTDGVLLDLQAEGLEDGRLVKWWAMHHVRIDGDQVVEHIAHCSGMLDEQQAKRQAEEAPMVRPR